MYTQLVERPLTQEIYFNSVALEMVEIPSGTFLMGALPEEKNSMDMEHPQHQVTIAQFLMGKYAITQAQWKAVAGLRQIKHKLEPNPSEFKGDDRPVERVSWYDAVEFCARLSQHTGREFRLPSEAEWEYACRGGTSTAFHFGDTITTNLTNYNNVEWEYACRGGTSTAFHFGDTIATNLRNYNNKVGSTTPVGEFPANAFGLYDMHGNVWEWCFDDWHYNYKGAHTDGAAWIKNDNHNRYQTKVRRGGSWAYDPENCRSASRSNFFPHIRVNDGGFRVVCAVAQRILQ